MKMMKNGLSLRSTIIMISLVSFLVTGIRHITGLHIMQSSPPKSLANALDLESLRQCNHFPILGAVTNSSWASDASARTSNTNQYAFGSAVRRTSIAPQLPKVQKPRRYLRNNCNWRRSATRSVFLELRREPVGAHALD